MPGGRDSGSNSHFAMVCAVVGRNKPARARRWAGVSGGIGRWRRNKPLLAGARRGLFRPTPGYIPRPEPKKGNAFSQNENCWDSGWRLAHTPGRVQRLGILTGHERGVTIHGDGFRLPVRQRASSWCGLRPGRATMGRSHAPGFPWLPSFIAARFRHECCPIHYRESL